MVTVLFGSVFFMWIVEVLVECSAHFVGDLRTLEIGGTRRRQGVNYAS